MPDLPAAETAIIEMTNAFRASNKLAAVRIDPKLSAAARSYAEFLARSQKFSHTADGRRPADRIKAASYAMCQSAENLAMFLDSRGFETRQLARKMVEGWKNSPGHRKNMLLPNVTETGVAIAKARGEEKYYSVQLFGRPERLKYQFEIQNRSNLAIKFNFGDKAEEIKPGYGIRRTACSPYKLSFTLPDGEQPSFTPKDGSAFTLKRGRGGRLVVISGTLDRLKLWGKDG